MSLATLTNKGQITIPKSIRQTLGLRPGDKIEFIVDQQGEVFCRPIIKKVDDVFGKLQKSGIAPVSVKAMNDAIRRRIKESRK